MAKEAFFLAIEIEEGAGLSPEMLERYVSRAIRNYYKNDPEELFERGNKPSVSIVSETLNPQEFGLLKNYLLVTEKMIHKKDRIGKGKII